MKPINVVRAIYSILLLMLGGVALVGFFRVLSTNRPVAVYSLIISVVLLVGVDVINSRWGKDDNWSSLL